MKVKEAVENEPVRVLHSVTAAMTATIGLLTIIGVWTEEIGGAVTLALTGWILVAGEIIRSRVTPVAKTPAVEEPKP